MNERAIVAVLLAVAATAPGRAQEECGSELKSVIAVYSNQHDTAGPQFETWDIYLMDPEDLDASGSMSVWRHLPGAGSDWAPAISPDGKGRIVFDSNRNRGPEDPLNRSELFLMKADGRGPQKLLTRGSSASWSPDGKSIVFHASVSGAGVPINGNPGAPTSDSAIFVAEVGALLEDDAPQQLTHPPDGKVDDDADWSPAGGKIVFVRKDRVNPNPDNPTSAELYTVNVDGSELTCLTCEPGIAEEERSPAWSPDGQRIAYSCRKGVHGGNTLELCLMNADGSGVVKVTDNNVAELSPHWSADGTQIVFQRPLVPAIPGQGQQVWVMDADGTIQEGTQRTNTPGAHFFPSWGEIRVNCGENAAEN